MIQIVITKDCECERDKYESTKYPRPGLTVRSFNVGEKLELVEEWSNFYGNYYRVRTVKGIADISVENAAVFYELTGADVSSVLSESGGEESNLEFTAESADFGNSVDIAVCFLAADGEKFRGNLARIPTSAIPKLVEALTSFIKKE